MTSVHQFPSKLLPVLAQAFPNTFFTDPGRMQPLKVNIHHDLLAALPAGVSRSQAQRFLKRIGSVQSGLKTRLGPLEVRGFGQANSGVSSQQGFVQGSDAQATSVSPPL